MGFLDNLLNKGKRAVKREATRLVKRELKNLGLDTDSPRRSTTRRRTPARHAIDDARWFGPGMPIPLHGFTLEPLGYVGSTLARQSGKGNDPALINPRLPVREGRSTSAPTKLDYAEITPIQRHAYLRWLAEGRRDPDAPTWIVKLFVYGLERRVLVDLAPRHYTREANYELYTLGTELAALESLYGEKSATQLAETVFVLQLLAGDVPEPTTAATARGVALDLMLAQHAATRTPIGADLAWPWAMEGKRSAVIGRHPQLAQQLFTSRYQAAYAGTILLQPQTSSAQPYTARAANPGVRNLQLDTTRFPGWTDEAGALTHLQALVEDIGRDLAAYDRASRADGFDPDSLESLSLLPLGALDARHRQLVELRAWLEGAIAKPYGTPAPADPLLAMFGVASKKPTRAECERVSSLLERLGYGIEPDVRVGGDTIAPGTRVVLFRMPQPLPPTPIEPHQLLQLRFGAAVAMAHGGMTQPELNQLTSFIEAAGTHPSVRGHLYARLIYLSLTPVRLTGLTKHVRALTPEHISAITDFLKTLAACEGQVHPDEMAVLDKIWKLLGLDASSLSSDLHQTMTSTTKPSAGLDPERIARTQQETRVISELLGDIFAEEEPAAPTPVTMENAICTFSGAQSALLRAVLAGQSLSETAFAVLAESHQLMPGGALDAINQHALDTCGEPLLEPEGDMLIINEWAREQLAE